MQAQPGQAQYGQAGYGRAEHADDRPAERHVPGHRMGRYDDARTMVVRDVLAAVTAELTAQTGRARLDIVDVGGGTGGFAVPLAAAGHTVTVLDPSPDSLAAAQRRAAEMCVPLRAVQGDATDLAALTGEQGADLVLCHSVLEYVDSPAAAMTAVASVLRPGGAVSVLAASAVAAVIHRALAGRFDEARRLIAAVAADRSRGRRAGSPWPRYRADRGGRAAPRPGARHPGVHRSGARFIRRCRPGRRGRPAGAGAGHLGAPGLP